MKPLFEQKVSVVIFYCAVIFISVLLSTAAWAETGCPAGMTNHWRLDETSGTSFIDSSGTANAVCSGSTCPGFASGRISGALQFDGIDDGLEVPPNAAFDWGNGNSFTIEFWMKPDNADSCTSTRVLVGREETNKIHWWVGCESGMAAFFLFDKTRTGGYVYGNGTLAGGAWHHIVAVRDAAAAEIRIYVDGLKEGTSPLTFQDGFDSATAPLTLGWLTNPQRGYYFAGAMDEVALYSRELSENEIRQHYYDGSTGLRWGYCGCSQPVRIMPLGDSITHGIYGDPPDETRTDDLIGGYRLPLYQSLTGAGHYVDFVGGLSSGGSLSSFDPEHEGHDGFCAKGGIYGDLDSTVQGYLSANPADVILLHIGTNDISFGNTGVVNDISTILDKIDAVSPGSVVVLSRIINRTDSAVNTVATTQFNNDLAAMASGRVAAGDRIIVADQEHALNYATDMASPLHPNSSGYGKMANVWTNTINDFLPVCGNVAPHIQSVPILQATAGKPYSYDVNADGNPAPAFSFVTAPQGMTINAVTGLISWMPAAAGEVPVQVQCSNGVGGDTQSFTIQVAEAPACPSGMIHYWKLDEIAGPPYKDFYWINDAVCTDCPVATTGLVNGAQLFNGATNMVNIPSDVSFDWSSTASFSIEFWMKQESADTCLNTRVAVGRDKPEGVHWWVGCEGGKAAFFLYDSTRTGAGVYGLDNALNDTNWHHIVAVRDGTANALRIFVDGQLQGMTNVTYSGGFDALFTEVNIGWLDLEHGYHFNGAIDEIALYDRALRWDEVYQHHAYGLGTVPMGYCEEAAPSIISTPVTGVTAGQTYTYDVNAIGNPTPAYSFSVTPPQGMTINSSTGVINWTPVAAGDYSVKVQASNGIGSPAEQSFTVTVAGIPPAITSTAVTSVVVGQAYTYDVEATGTPAPAYSFSGTPPEGMTINSSTGVINWTPVAVGSYPVTVQASNGTGSPATQNFEITVNNVPPTWCENWPVWLGGIMYQPTIQDAYQSLSAGATLKIANIEVAGNLDFSDSGKAFALELQGGYSCDFLTRGGFTVVGGQVTIGSGTVVMDSIIIR